MIIVQLKGGMGNQMFQYALGRVLSLRHGVELGLDARYLGKKPAWNNDTVREYCLGSFCVAGRLVTSLEVPLPYKITNPLFARLFDRAIGVFLPTKDIAIERGHGFEGAALASGPNAYLSGWWQSYKYIEGCEDVVRADFSFREALPGHIETLGHEILAQHSVCVHVRRGDYVGNTKHDTVTIEYYRKALELLRAKGATLSVLYVFSDDVAWCKEHIQFDTPSVVFVGPEYTGVKDTGHLYLMSQCKHFIIANSSFSWWAAWLSENPEKVVIAPKRWFNDDTIDTSDLTPPSWIRL